MSVPRLALRHALRELELRVPQRPAAEVPAEVGEVVDGLVQHHAVDHEVDQVPGVAAHRQPGAGPQRHLLPVLELETKVHMKVCNHGEGPYQGIHLDESGYYCSYI